MSLVKLHGIVDDKGGLTAQLPYPVLIGGIDVFVDLLPLAPGASNGSQRSTDRSIEEIRAQ